MHLRDLLFEFSNEKVFNKERDMFMNLHTVEAQVAKYLLFEVYNKGYFRSNDTHTEVISKYDVETSSTVTDYLSGNIFGKHTSIYKASIIFTEIVKEFRDAAMNGAPKRLASVNGAEFFHIDTLYPAVTYELLESNIRELDDVIGKTHDVSAVHLQSTLGGIRREYFKLLNEPKLDVPDVDQIDNPLFIDNMKLVGPAATMEKIIHLFNKYYKED